MNTLATFEEFANSFDEEHRGNLGSIRLMRGVAPSGDWWIRPFREHLADLNGVWPTRTNSEGAVDTGFVSHGDFHTAMRAAYDRLAPLAAAKNPTVIPPVPTPPAAAAAPVPVPVPQKVPPAKIQLDRIEAKIDRLLEMMDPTPQPVVETIEGQPFS